MNRSLIALKELETEIDEICKKGGYPYYIRPSEIAREIKEKFRIVKAKSDCDKYQNTNTIIIPKDIEDERDFVNHNSLLMLDYDIDLLIEEPEYPFISGDILINKNIDKSQGKLIMIYLDHPAIDKRSLLYPGITSLNDLKNITDCFVPYLYIVFKINIDNNGTEYVEYSKSTLTKNDPWSNIAINDKYLDIRKYELYTIEEENLLYKHYDYINRMSNMAKRGYDDRFIEEQYREFVENL